jgi:endonuclease/exonuclease/phosphatase family metal-dependent hydrolase
VLVFNIHAGKDAAGADNLGAVAALVQEVKADVVLLQEVDRLTKRSGKVDQVKVLGDKTGFATAFGRSLDFDGGQYGIAALARAGVEAHFTRSLPVSPVQTRSGGSYEPRAALAVVARTPRGRLTAINTHLDASREEHYRLQEVEHLLETIRRTLQSGLPLVAGGDFNAEPGSEVHKRVLAAGLRDAWMECGAGDGLTYPADKPIKRIDYLFLTGSVRCTTARVIETTISDHRPLLVSVR